MFCLFLAGKSIYENYGDFDETIELSLGNNNGTGEAFFLDDFYLTF